MYKTLFIEAEEIPKKSILDGRTMQINGDNLARDVEAGLAEARRDGYILRSMQPVTSSRSVMSSYSYSFTSGMLLVLEKVKDNA